MKTTFEDFNNSIVPGVISLQAHSSFKQQETSNNDLSKVKSLLRSDNVFNQFLSTFRLQSVSIESLISAFSHSSFVNERESDSFHSYERLELLGDSVLELIITEKLFTEFPDLSEGVLSKIRGQLVSKEELATLGKMIGLHHFILVGRGEYQQKVFLKDSILADLFESLLGAIFKDLGLESARAFVNQILRFYEEKMGHAFISIARVEGKNYKGRLQELLMKQKKDLPKYTDVELDSGEFLVTVTIGNKVLGKSIHISKKQAQVNAAKDALSLLTQ